MLTADQTGFRTETLAERVRKSPYLVRFPILHNYAAKAEHLLNNPATLRFLLNGHKVELDSVDCHQTLLGYIREHAHLCGTKEGCAEGDCGACTVLIGRLLRGQLIYETVNACIRLLPSVHACHVVTIESLLHNHRLHAAQQAMLEQQGSQCGFCTPGIVMSLYALWMENPTPGETDIRRALQGNLCRCTGYAPIIKAARQAAGNTDQAQDPLFSERKEVTATLLAWQSDTTQVFMDGIENRFIRPGSIHELGKTLSIHPDATILGGSTDIGLWINKAFKPLSPVVSVAHLDELHRIDLNEEGITLGAAVTYTESVGALLDTYPSLRSYWYRIGGEQVRNMGTLGGNIANGSPIGDTPAPLIALGARLQLVHENGAREIALEDFFIAYGKQDLRAGEFIASIFIPAASQQHPLQRANLTSLDNATGSTESTVENGSSGSDIDNCTLFSAYKISKRFDEDISTVCCAFKVQITKGIVNEAVLAYGGMAGTPLRAKSAEQCLLGKPWNSAVVDDVCAAIETDFEPLSDARASATYRRIVAANLFKRFYVEFCPSSNNACDSDNTCSNTAYSNGYPVRLSREIER